jgi:hypothetical protein
MARTPPQRIADSLEEIASRGMPTPPQVVGQVDKAPDTVRDRNSVVHQLYLLL